MVTRIPADQRQRDWSRGLPKEPCVQVLLEGMVSDGATAEGAPWRTGERVDGREHKYFKMASITEMFKYFKCIFESMAS